MVLGGLTSQSLWQRLTRATRQPKTQARPQLQSPAGSWARLPPTLATIQSRLVRSPAVLLPRLRRTLTSPQSRCPKPRSSQHVRLLAMLQLLQAWILRRQHGQRAKPLPQLVQELA